MSSTFPDTPSSSLESSPAPPPHLPSSGDGSDEAAGQLSSGDSLGMAQHSATEDDAARSLALARSDCGADASATTVEAAVDDSDGDGDGDDSDAAQKRTLDETMCDSVPFPVAFLTHERRQNALHQLQETEGQLHSIPPQRVYPVTDWICPDGRRVWSVTRKDISTSDGTWQFKDGFYHLVVIWLSHVRCT